MRSVFVTRIRIISTAVVLVAIVLIGRLYFVQIVHGDEYSERADHQYARPQEGLFERGNIFFEDKDGNRAYAATLKSGFTLAINPTKIDDPETLYDVLADIVTLDRDEFFIHTAKSDDPYEVIAHELSREDADAVVALELPGVGLYKEQWRYYPGRDLAAQTIGFVAFDDDMLTGRYGLERYYNDVLSRDVDTTYVNFFAEVFSNIGEILDAKDARQGDVVATIEPTVQAALEKALREVRSEWQSTSVGGIVINPKTGEVYALAVNPTLDLNNFQDEPNLAVFGNPLVEGVFEMGSIMKPITMAAGLDAGAVTPFTTYDDKGYLVLDDGNARISNFDGKGRGVVNMQRVLGESLNTGAAFVVNRMGNNTFAEYLQKFGLGEETGIDLPGEVRGFLDNLNSPRDVEYTTAAFGQGIALTPIATVRALAALGNGGYLISPHIVKRVEYDVGPARKVFYNPSEQVVTKETSEEITRMLVNVVDEYLLGGTVKLEHYSVAAKTGTAQIPNPATGEYYDDRFFHSFFGYFPAYDPQFLVFLYNDQPVGARYASQTLTHPFINLAKFLISYYEVPPDR
ncbi:penicillin-binding protein 2 [Candidatus Wolfebacteria bacterium]|nr:penicillin-binding protein 2 [Candidatus Wolfebacteria bacterium]